MLVRTLVVALLLSTTPVAYGQRKTEAKDWLQGEVQFLITQEERQVYGRLTTPEEREHFIEQFWKRRDPNPETVANEFREEFYRRVAYANENFTAGTPGWRTDRGRIYVLYGPPNRRDARPMGGRYQKPFSQGGDTITTYAFEIWEYDFIPGIGSDISIEFVDRTHSGVYTLETDPNRKDVFFWRRGEMRPQRAYAAKDMPFERLRVWAKLQAPPPLQFPKLREEIKANVSFAELPFDVSTAYVRISPDLYALPITVAIANDRLMYIGKEGFYQSDLQLYAAVTNLAGAIVYQFDELFHPRSDGIPLPELVRRRTYHQRIVPVPPGRYRIQILVKDVNSGKLSSREVTAWIPQPQPDAVNTSSLIYADVIQPAGEASRGDEFVLGPLKVVPNPSAAFPRRHRVGVYLEAYDLALDAQTGKPSVDVSFVLVRPDGGRIDVGRAMESRFEEGSTLVVSKAIPVESVSPGKYRVQVRIADRIAGRESTLEGEVQIL
jgi:GWxTD domain-containing protein